MSFAEKLKEKFGNFSKPYAVEVDFTPNFNDLDTLEVNMIELAHKMTMCDRPTIRAVGRAMKLFAPSWLSFIRGEQERELSMGASKDHNPCMSVHAAVSSFALMSSMMVAGMAKPQAKREVLDDLSDKFSKEIKSLEQEDD